MGSPILPTVVHNNKHIVSAGLGLGTGVVANQVFSWSVFDSALLGGGVFLLSEALITLDEPEAFALSAPGINIIATPEGKGTVRVSGSVLVPKDGAPQMIDSLKATAQDAVAKKAEKAA